MSRPAAFLRATGILAGSMTAGCGGWQSALDPQSSGPAAIARLWWVMFSVTGILATGVFVVLLYAIYRARRAAEASTGAEVARGERRVIVLSGAALPALVLVGFVALSVRTGVSLQPPSEETALTVEVVAHQFWWHVHYPDHGITTANEIHIPVGVPVEVRLRSADVIHSFWVPQISPGKLDMIPGREHLTWMMAEVPGSYRGQCTEFCGVQHALMSLLVLALPEEEFEGWVADRQEAAPPPEEDAPLAPDALPPDTIAPAEATSAGPVDVVEARGRAVFIREGCSTCHAVRGLISPDFAGDPGPDLTHLATRRTLGALTIPNDRANLAGWIADPHQFKPGVRMPATALDGPDLQALLAFLETLH